MNASARSASRRVAVFTVYLAVGGAQAQLVRLVGDLVERGDEVRVISLLPNEAYEKEMAELGVPVVELRGGRVRSVAYIAQAWRALREFRPDVVISFLYQANVVARVAGRLAGSPVVISSIRNEYFGGRARELVMRATDRLASITTTNSAFARASLVRRRVTPAERLVLIPNGVDVDRFAPPAAVRAQWRAAVRDEFGSGDGFVWLAAGRVAPQKDFATLLAAFAPHHAAHPQSRLVIAGDGELRPSLEAQAAQLGVAAAVTFAGLRSDMPALLCASDAFVLSSAWEGLPNVVMEAMAAGLPVVATRVGGVAELVDDPDTGRIVEPGDAGALTAAMNELAELTPARRAEVGARGHAKIAAGWSAGAARTRWLELIDGCEGKPVAGSRV